MYWAVFSRRRGKTHEWINLRRHMQNCSKIHFKLHEDMQISPTHETNLNIWVFSVFIYLFLFWSHNIRKETLRPHTNKHTYIHTYKCKYTITHTHTYTHMQTHTQTNSHTLKYIEAILVGSVIFENRTKTDWQNDVGFFSTKDLFLEHRETTLFLALPPLQKSLKKNQQKTVTVIANNTVKR